MGSLTDNHVLDLLAAGADAMPNMFDVKINLPSAIATLDAAPAGTESGLASSTTETLLTLRVKGFKIPEASNETYQVSYKTVTIDRPKTKLVLDRKIELVFRLDANWKVYKALYQWSSFFANPETGYATNQLPAAGLGSIDLSALKTTFIANSSGGWASIAGVTNDTFAETDSNLWKFGYAWCQKVTPPDFTTGEASGAQEVTATFYFATMQVPSDFRY